MIFQQRAEPINGRAELLIGQRRGEAALQQYRELARLTPDDARVQRGLLAQLLTSQ